jgi:dynein heavy chain
MKDPKFSLESAASSSFAIKFIFSWVKAMYDFYKVYTETEPIRVKLEEMR